MRPEAKWLKRMWMFCVECVEGVSFLIEVITEKDEVYGEE